MSALPAQKSKAIARPRPSRRSRRGSIRTPAQVLTSVMSYWDARQRDLREQLAGIAVDAEADPETMKNAVSLAAQLVQALDRCESVASRLAPFVHGRPGEAASPPAPFEHLATASPEAPSSPYLGLTGDAPGGSETERKIARYLRCVRGHDDGDPPPASSSSDDPPPGGPPPSTPSPPSSPSSPYSSPSSPSSPRSPRDGSGGAAAPLPDWLDVAPSDNVPDVRRGPDARPVSRGLSDRACDQANAISGTGTFPPRPRRGPPPSFF